MTTKLRASLLLFSLAGIAGVIFYFSIGQTSPPADPDKEAALVRTILSGMERLHFQPKEVNDEFSRQLYQLYLQDLDNGKRFFTQADIAQMEPFATQLDDEAKNGTFAFFNLSLRLYEAALEKTQVWYREALDKPLDFSVHESLETDGKKLKWAKDDAELRDRWRRWMKYEVLNRINIELRKQEKADFTGEKKSFETLEKEQREKTLETYDRFFKRLKKADRARRLELYLDALTNVFDPHSGYYSPKEKENFDIQMSGKLEGIGARLQSDGEKTTILEIVP
ncbi:MAG: tail-specific protease, partial [Saprospiraceae bacterium]